MKNIFFCFGVPKSGTTYLQSLLNAHPRVSCPSEQQLEFFLQQLPSLLNAYNDILFEVDNRTARQGVTPLRVEDAQHLLREVIMLVARRGAANRDVAWFGIKDNAIIRRIPFYRTLFPDARFVCIVRDPRDVTVSSWHHNLRVESGFLERVGDLERWAEVMGRVWQEELNDAWAASGQGSDPRLLFCRYETLIGDTGAAMGELFAFLGVAADAETIAAVQAATDFNKVGGKGDNPFFRKGRAGDWRQTLPEAAVARVERAAGDFFMERFGYGRCVSTHPGGQEMIPPAGGGTQSP